MAKQYKYADVVELVDTLVLEASASAWEFESPHPHHPRLFDLKYKAVLARVKLGAQRAQCRQLLARLLHHLPDDIVRLRIARLLQVFL